MVKTILVLISCIFILSCSKKKQTSSELITNQDIYKSLKLVLKDLAPTHQLENTENYYLIDELATPSFVNENPSFKLEKYFSKEDIISIKKQLTTRLNFKIHPDSIKPKRILSKKTLDSFLPKESKNRKESFLKNYTEQFGTVFYHSFSLPIFSKDKKTFLIDVSSLNGGYSILFKNINNKWKSEVVCAWVS